MGLSAFADDTGLAGPERGNNEHIGRGGDAEIPAGVTYTSFRALNGLMVSITRRVFPSGCSIPMTYSDAPDNHFTRSLRRYCIGPKKSDHSWRGERADTGSCSCHRRKGTEEHLAESTRCGLCR